MRAFQRLLELRPDERRAQEQLKKRYAALRDWDALEAFYATTDKWDELIRVFEREGDDANVAVARAHLAALARGAAVGREEGQARSRGALVREDPRARRRQPRRGRRAQPDLRAGQGSPRSSPASTRCASSTSRSPKSGSCCCARPACSTRRSSRTARTAFDKFLEAFALAPTRELTREDAARLAARSRAAGIADRRPTSRPSTAAADPLDVTDLRLCAGSVLAQIGRTDEAIKQLAEVYDAEPDNMRAAQALEPLYRQTGRYADVLEIYRKRQELETDRDVRTQLAYHIAALTEQELKKPTEAIERYRQIIDEYGDDELDAYRALERLYEEQGALPSSPRCCSAASICGPSSDEELAALKFRLARVPRGTCRRRPRPSSCTARS